MAVVSFKFCLSVSIVSSVLGWCLGYPLSKALLFVEMNSSCNIWETSALQPQFILGCQTPVEFMANSCLISQHSGYACRCQHHLTWKRQLNNQRLWKEPGRILAVKQSLNSIRCRHLSFWVFWKPLEPAIRIQKAICLSQFPPSHQCITFIF